MKLNSIQIVVDGSYDPGQYQWMITGSHMIINILYRDTDRDGCWKDWKPAFDGTMEAGINPKDAKLIAEAIQFVAEYFDQ